MMETPQTPEKGKPTVSGKKRKRRSITYPSKSDRRRKGKCSTTNSLIKVGLAVSDRNFKINRLQRACRDGKIEEVMTYIDNMGHRDLMKRSACNDTALHYAIQEGNTDCAMAILHHDNLFLTDKERVELSNLCTQYNSPAEIKSAILGEEQVSAFDYIEEEEELCDIQLKPPSEEQET